MNSSDKEEKVTRYFGIVVRCAAILDLDQEVIDAVEIDGWQKNFYDMSPDKGGLSTAEKVAEMVGRCAVAYRTPLTGLDGWGDKEDWMARVHSQDWDTGMVVELTREEVAAILETDDFAGMSADKVEEAARDNGHGG